MATTFFANHPIPYFFTLVVVVLLLLQLQCQAARNFLHVKKNYDTFPTNTIQNKAVTDDPQTPAPAPAPTISYISSTPASSPVEAPAPAPAADYETTSQYYSALDNEEEEEEEEEFSSDKEVIGNFNAYKETTDEDFTNNYSNVETSSLTGDGDGDDEDANNAFWTSHREGYKRQPQGMSDTRLAGNSNLYNNKYNLYNENENENENARLQPDENYTPTWSGNQLEPQGYYSTERPHEGQHRSRFEFDSMEEYEKQEGYTNVDVRQDGFFP